MKNFIKFIFLCILLTLFFFCGKWSTQEKYEEKIRFIQIEKRSCEATFNLFKNDMEAFCAESFERMSC